MPEVWRLEDKEGHGVYWNNCMPSAGATNTKPAPWNDGIDGGEEEMGCGDPYEEETEFLRPVFGFRTYNQLCKWFNLYDLKQIAARCLGREGMTITVWIVPRLKRGGRQVVFCRKNALCVGRVPIGEFLAFIKRKEK